MKTWQDEEDLELFEKYELRYFYLVYVNGYSEEEANLEIESEAMNHRIVIGLIVHSLCMGYLLSLDVFSNFNSLSLLKQNRPRLFLEAIFLRLFSDYKIIFHI